MAESKKGLGLSAQIMIGMFLGIIFGYIFPVYGVQLKVLGDLFIRMVKMIVVPLIFSSLVMGIAGTGDFKKLGRLGAKAFLWFEFATTIALVVGLVVVNVFQPGAGVVLSNVDAAGAQQAASKTIDIMQSMINIVPTNIVDGMSRGDMLQIVFFSTFFGVATAAVGTKGEPVVNLATSIADIMFKVTAYVMKLAPYGVFGLSAFTVGKFGLGMLIPLAKLIGSLYFALALFLGIILLLALTFFRVKPLDMIKLVKEPAMIAFTTTSSEAALPVAMEKLEQFGVPKNIVTFVLPTGYTFNLDGSTLYCALSIMFVAQIYHIDYTLTEQILIMITLMMATKGIAAVPGASFIVVAGTAASLGLPLEGIALLMGVDRVLDMARTGCNMIGNCIATVIIARSEGKLSEETMEMAYSKVCD